MKRYLPILLPALLAACATGPRHVDVPGLSRSDGVVLHDTRPADESQAKALSMLITSDAYGITRTGDTRIEPPAARLVTHRIFEHAGAGSQVTIHHLVTYANSQSELRRNVTFVVLGGLVGAAIASATTHDAVAVSTTDVRQADFESLSGDDEWKRGAYTPQENPDKISVLVTYLDAEVNGKRAFVRVVSPAKLPDGRDAYVESLGLAVNQVMKEVGALPPAPMEAQTAVPAAPIAVAAATITAVAPIAPAPAPIAAPVVAPAPAVTAPVAVAAATITTAAPVAPAPAPVAVPVVAREPAAIAPAAPVVAAATLPIAAVASTSLRHPDGARRLDAFMLQGHTLVYVDPKDARKAGEIRLTFVDDHVDASNSGSKTFGYYHVVDDMLCVTLEGPTWGRTCVYVVDADPSRPEQVKLLFAADGHTTPLRIE